MDLGGVNNIMLLTMISFFVYIMIGDKLIEVDEQE